MSDVDDEVARMFDRLHDMIWPVPGVGTQLGPFFETADETMERCGLAPSDVPEQP